MPEAMNQSLEQAVDQAKLDHKAAELVQEFRKLTEGGNATQKQVFNLFQKHGLEQDRTFVSNDEETVKAVERQFASGVLIKEFDLGLKDMKNIEKSVDSATEATDIASHVANSKEAVHKAKVAASQLFKQRDSLLGFEYGDHELDATGERVLAKMARKLVDAYREAEKGGDQAVLKLYLKHDVPTPMANLRVYTMDYFVNHVLKNEFGNPKRGNPIDKSIKDAYAKVETQVAEEKAAAIALAKAEADKAEKKPKGKKRRGKRRGRGRKNR